jgi:flagellar biosynthetic protein FlhB
VSEDADESSKTEDPTAKKIEESRRKGHVPHSRDMDAWLMLLAATILVGTAAPGIMAELRDILAVFLENAHAMPGMPGGFGAVMGPLVGKVIGILIVPFCVLLFMAVLGPFAQVGALFAPEAIKPDFSKVSIMKGFGRLFSVRSVVEFLKGLAKITFLGIVMYFILEPYIKNGGEQMIDQPLPIFLADFKDITIKIMIGALVALFFVAVGDLAYQRLSYTKSLRMTKQEVKDEFKQTEGDPHIRARMRQLRMEKARQRMMAAVPTANVVITNPTHYAIALKYDAKEMDAPVVVAKGVDFIAQKIREVATEHKVMIVENPPLARSLYASVELDQMIPSEFFKAVAEVISYVYQKQGKIKPRTIH